MIGGVFVRALNENRTRGLPLRRRTLYPLSYKGVASFSRPGVTPEPVVCPVQQASNRCVAGNQFDVLPPSSSSWFRTRTMGSKDPCAAVTPRRNVRERIGHVCPTAFRHADPTRFLLTGFQALSRGLSLQIG